MAWLTCHTQGCGNEGVPIELDIIDPETGEPVSSVLCGPCGQPITDVSDTAPA